MNGDLNFDGTGRNVEIIANNIDIGKSFSNRY